VSRSHGDRADGSDKIRLLKKQVDSLKREIARLERELRKAHARIAEHVSTSEEEHVEEPRLRKKGEGSTCTSCGKGTMIAWSIPVRGVEKVYLTCNLCEARRPAGK